jgi:hypothetical protein
MAERENDQSKMSVQEAAAWNDWQRYLSKSEAKRGIIAVSSGVGTGIAIGTAILGLPLALCAAPIVAGIGGIVYHNTEKEADRVWKDTWLTPWRTQK